MARWGNELFEYSLYEARISNTTLRIIKSPAYLLNFSHIFHSGNPYYPIHSLGSLCLWRKLLHGSRRWHILSFTQLNVGSVFLEICSFKKNHESIQSPNKTGEDGAWIKYSHSRSVHEAPSCWKVKQSNVKVSGWASKLHGNLYIVYKLYTSLIWIITT